MSWRTGLVVVLTVSGLGIPVAAVQAAPMTGVTFVDPARVFDAALPVGVTTIGLGVPPPGVTQALVTLTGVMNVSQVGLLMAGRCGVAANPATDGVLPIEPLIGNSARSNQVYLPSNGTICVTATAPLPRLVVDLEGWVTSGAGAGYVDLPFTLVTTIDGPVTHATIDLSTVGVPVNSTGVAVWLDTFSSTAGSATLYPCDEMAPLKSHAAWASDDNPTTLVAGVRTSAVGLCINITDGASVDISIDGYYALGATPTSTSPSQERYVQESAPGFIGTSPTRLFDTRGTGVVVSGGDYYRLDLSPFVPIGTSAVAMNVTATQTTDNGYVTVYPCDGTLPDTSSVNFGPDQTVPNFVTVDAGSSREVCFYASATTHLFADLAGYYVFGGGDGFSPSTPVRLFDTRDTTKLDAASVYEFDLSTYVSVDASSAAFNLTATQVEGPGYVTAFPCEQNPPVASNLNVSAGQTVPNLVTVALPTNKHVCFFTLSAAHLLADLAGWYAPSAASGFVAVSPTRWIDTRDLGDPLPASSTRPIDFSVDFPDATAIALNATVTQPDGPGYLTVFPCDSAVPQASNVNYSPGQTVPNMVITSVGSTGRACLFNLATLHWIVDVTGYFTEKILFYSYFPDGTDVL